MKLHFVICVLPLTSPKVNVGLRVWLSLHKKTLHNKQKSTESSQLREGENVCVYVCVFHCLSFNTPAHTLFSDEYVNKQHAHLISRHIFFCFHKCSDNSLLIFFFFFFSPVCGQRHLKWISIFPLTLGSTAREMHKISALFVCKSKRKLPLFINGRVQVWHLRFVAVGLRLGSPWWKLLALIEHCLHWFCHSLLHKRRANCLATLTVSSH